MGFFEHSKKAGRIVALISAIIITGTLSIMAGFNDPDNVKILVEKWLLVMGPILGYYFSQTQKET